MHVVPEDMRRAAREVADAEEQVRANKPTEVGQVSAALPGSASSGAAATLEATWTATYSTWGTSARAYATQLREAADTWDGVDQQGARRFGAPTPI